MVFSNFFLNGLAFHLILIKALFPKLMKIKQKSGLKKYIFIKAIIMYTLLYSGALFFWIISFYCKSASLRFN